jgi:hypothetical protein
MWHFWGPSPSRNRSLTLLEESRDQKQYHALLDPIVRAVRSSFRVAKLTELDTPAPTLRSNYTLVQLDGIPFVQFTLTFDIDPETYFHLDPLLPVRTGSDPTIQKHEEEDTEHFDWLESILINMLESVYQSITRLIDTGRLNDIDEEDRCPLRFSKRTMRYFFYNNRIPLLYRLPEDILQYEPDLPEFTYMGIRDNRDCYHVEYDPIQEVVHVYMKRPTHKK